MDNIKIMVKKIDEIYKTEDHENLDTEIMLIEKSLTDYLSSQLVSKESVSSANVLLADMKRLLTISNGVTAFHRHGNKIPQKKLDNLSNLTTEFYEKYMYEKET